MKKILRPTLVLMLTLAITLSLFAAFAYVSAAGSAPDITAEAAFAVDLESGKTIFFKNADDRMYPASLTKLMTALLVFESIESDADYEEVITATTSAVNNQNLSGDGSSAGILPGEKLTMWDLLNFLLIQSANDAANVLAEKVSGSVASFVDRMNERARELGMENTHFMNPHGEHNEEHYTTAADIARVMAELITHDDYLKIARTKQYRKPATAKYKHERVFNNTNRMLYTGSDYYESTVLAGKTGTTTPAGSCLCTYAEKEGLKLIIVTLKSKKDAKGTYNFPDQYALYKWIYSIYRSVAIVNAGTPIYEVPVRLSEASDSVTIAAADTLYYLTNVNTYDPAKVSVVPQREVLELTLNAPVTRGQRVGLADVYYDDLPCGTVPLECIGAVERSDWLYYRDRIASFFRLTVVRILLCLLAAAFIAWVILREIGVRRREAARNRRRLSRINERGDRF